MPPAKPELTVADLKETIDVLRGSELRKNATLRRLVAEYDRCRGDVKPGVSPVAGAEVT